MTQQQRQGLIAATAAACRAMADLYDPKGGEDEDLMEAWYGQRDVYDALVQGCPACDPDDPGPPPPPN